MQRLSSARVAMARNVGSASRLAKRPLGNIQLCTVGAHVDSCTCCCCLLLLLLLLLLLFVFVTLYVITILPICCKL